MTSTVSVACPKCGAAVGKPCVTTGGIVRRDYPHLARRKAFDRVLDRAVAKETG